MTRSHARWTRAAALVALIGGTLAVSAAPALGAPAPVSILSVSATDVKPGDKVKVKFRVTNTGRGAAKAIVVVGGGLPCASGCRAEPRLRPGKSKDFQATVVAPAVSAGETLGVNISVGVRLDGKNSFAYQMVTIHGSAAPKPAPKVTGLSGRVRDTSGKALGGAALSVRDGAGQVYRATSDRDGRFSIKSIAVGRLTASAVLDGYRPASTTAQAAAGDTASVQLTMTAVPATAAPSPAASSPSPVASSAAPAALTTASGEGSGPVPFILGGLLIGGGLTALAVVVVRRRKKPAPALADAPTTMLPTVQPTDRYPGR
ncbi:carboxypeptidase-like regulatory domain-containing protein [Actinoplanes sp. CA-054009]